MITMSTSRNFIRFYITRILNVIVFLFKNITFSIRVIVQKPCVLLDFVVVKSSSRQRHFLVAKWFCLLLKKIWKKKFLPVWKFWYCCFNDCTLRMEERRSSRGGGRGGSFFYLGGGVVMKYFQDILMGHELFLDIFNGPRNIFLSCIFVILFFKLRGSEHKTSKLAFKKI